jgi:hypothetical protein
MALTSGVTNSTIEKQNLGLKRTHFGQYYKCTIHQWKIMSRNVIKENDLNLPPWSLILRWKSQNMPIMLGKRRQASPLC